MRARNRRVVAALVTAAALTAGGGAWADDQAKARDLFNAGVAAYEDGKFLHAAQAFIESHKLLGKPQLLFSTAQAFRRQFDADGTQQHLGLAIKYYKAYLDAVPEGGRRVDAARALGELRPLLQDGESAGEMSFPTRVSVTTSVKGAVASIDGGPWVAVPFNSDIAPGPHKVVLRAAGYHEASRDFLAEKGRVAPIDVPLRGVTPRLVIEGADGAEISVDGRSLGEAPFSDAVEVEPGTYFVSVTKNGHKPYAAELELGYGATTQVVIDMPATEQRRVAWGVLATGGAGLVAAGVLAGLAFVEQANARDIGDAQTAGSITPEERIAHNDAIEARDDLRLAAVVAAGAGATVTLTGLFLYLFDEPVVASPMKGADQPSDERPPPEPSDMEMMGAPVLSPSHVGFTLMGRF